MPSHKPAFFWLLEKEWRGLLASRAWWIFLALMGPLVGVSFIGAVRIYGEASGLNGTAAGVGEAFSPLVGIWAPTFSACEIAAVFLLPFVAIRQVAGDRQSGALKLELQQPMPSFLRMAAKVLVLFAGWMIALLAPLGAVLLWKSCGGSIYLPELATVGFGHVLNAGLTIALGAAAASIAENPSTAAIFTLAATVGCWVLDFIAAVEGGLWERVASYTPAAMVGEFQHGLLRASTVMIALTLILAGLAVAAVWMRIGVAVWRRVFESIGVGAVCAAVIFFFANANKSWDLSENRMNSFPMADDAALRGIREPLTIVVHLAPEDPRRVDLERRALSKLRRVMPGVRIRYESATSIGLFEQTNPNYGEIWYELGGRKAVSRATTQEGVLEAIYSLSGSAPAEDQTVFRGHPLAVGPRGAAWVFYGLWPALAVGAGFFLQRRPS